MLRRTAKRPDSQAVTCGGASTGQGSTSAEDQGTLHCTTSVTVLLAEVGSEHSSYQLYKDLSDATEAALRASIRHFGVILPVVYDQHGNVLDGHQRLRIAAELHVDVPATVIAVTDDAHAREIARTLNEDRRAMPRAERIEVVKALREEGHSVRAIAAAVGSPPSTIQGDLATVRTRTVEEPERITGLDGKERPAQRPAAPVSPSPETIHLEADNGKHSRLPRKDAQKVLPRFLSQLAGMAAAVGGLDFTDCHLTAGEVHELDEHMRVILTVRKSLKETSR